MRRRCQRGLLEPAADSDAFGPEYVPMAPGTAALMLLLSGAQLAHRRWPAAARRLGYAAVAVTTLFSLLVWAGWLLGVEPLPEDWLAPTAARAGGSPWAACRPRLPVRF